MSDNNEKIKKLQSELDQAKKEQAEFDALPENQRLAETIHSATCHSSHEDHCGWYYESWDKPLGSYSTRLSYLRKAQAILRDVDYKSAVLVIKQLNK